ncbi:MAG: bifunctional 4-hydroxy-2-oxoglutarate aldolase/2-dehydro-3-deoxy-phosphogluconate aldolase [Nitrospinaceae bacterium]
MSDSRFNLPRFEEEPVIGIIRGMTEEALPGVMEALAAGGLRFVEITFNTPNAPALIEKTARDYTGSLCLGAGTVLSLQDAETAVAAGAGFLVAPTLNDEVAAFCRERQLPYFPGALTPTEIERAWNAGASMVKIFPASEMGPAYFRMVKGPFQNIRLMAVGGVHSKNLSEYLAAGASAVALGGSIISPARMQKKQFDLIRNGIQEFLLAVRNFYSNIA